MWDDAWDRKINSDRTVYVDRLFTESGDDVSVALAAGGSHG